MPRRTDAYRETLRSLDDWTPFLLAECGLPGPRGNLELAAAVAEEGSAELFDAFLAYTPKRAPVNSPEEFLAFCGALGQGRLIVEGDTSRFTVLRALAADPRWRTREAVAMALQHVGDHDFDGLLAELERWLATGISNGAPLPRPWPSPGCSNRNARSGCCTSWMRSWPAWPAPGTGAPPPSLPSARDWATAGAW
ncbi:MAG: hypothetical protein P8Z36_05950 [Gemmatimonadota bacterium]